MGTETASILGTVINKKRRDKHELNDFCRSKDRRACRVIHYAGLPPVRVPGDSSSSSAAESRLGINSMVSGQKTELPAAAVLFQPSMLTQRGNRR